MLRDPRNPDPNYMCSNGGTNPAHSNLRKTLVLLKINADDPIYFVVEGLSIWPSVLEEMLEHKRYFYEEHSCPTNFIDVPLIVCNGDADPHGIFEFVDAVWMMDEYSIIDKADYLREVFPELNYPEEP